MDHAAGQVRGPARLQQGEVVAGARREPGRDAVGLGLGLREERAPGGHRQAVLTAQAEIGAGGVEPGERPAQRGAMVRVRRLHRDPVEEADDRRGAAAERAERRSVAVADRLRAGQPAGSQVLHQVDEERQVAGPHPLLVQGEDVGAGGGVQEEVGVLDAFRDALVGEQPADLVIGEEVGQRRVGYLGVDGHVVLPGLMGNVWAVARRRGGDGPDEARASSSGECSAIERTSVIRGPEGAPGSQSRHAGNLACGSGMTGGAFRRLRVRDRRAGTYSAASLRNSRGSGNTMSSTTVCTVSTVTV